MGVWLGVGKDDKTSNSYSFKNNLRLVSAKLRNDKGNILVEGTCHSEMIYKKEAQITKKSRTPRLIIYQQVLIKKRVYFN